MSTEMDAIRSRIQNRRQQLGYSYQDLSKITGISKSTLQRYETGGIGNLALDKVKGLAEALQCSPEWLMGWESSDKPAEKNNLQLDAKSFVEKVADERRLSKLDQEILEKCLELDERALSALLGYAYRLIEDRRNKPSEQDIPLDIDSQIDHYKRGLLMGIATAQANFTILPEDIDIESIPLTPELNAMVEDALKRKRRVLESNQNK